MLSGLITVEAPHPAVQQCATTRTGSEIQREPKHPHTPLIINKMLIMLIISALADPRSYWVNHESGD